MTPNWRPRAFQTIASVWIFLAATVADLKTLGYTSDGKIQRKFSGGGPVRRIFYFLENDGIRLHYCVPYACQKGAFLASSAVLAFRRISNLSGFRGFDCSPPTSSTNQFNNLPSHLTSAGIPVRERRRNYIVTAALLPARWID